MLFNAVVLKVLFKVSIFILFAYHMVRLISRYIVPSLHETIKHEHDETMRLVEKDKLLVSTKRRVEGQLHHQKMVFALLERNVQVWQKKAQQDVENKDAFHLLLEQEITQKRHLQEKNFNKHKDVSFVVSVAMKNAAQELEKRYGGGDGKKLLSTMIASLSSAKTSSQG
jgi:hypothetical protein